MPWNVGFSVQAAPPKCQIVNIFTLRTSNIHAFGIIMDILETSEIRIKFVKNQGRCQDIRMNINESYLSTLWVPPTSAADSVRSKVSARVMECLVSVPSLLKCKCPKHLIGLETPKCYKESALNDIDRKKWCKISAKYIQSLFRCSFFMLLWNFPKTKMCLGRTTLEANRSQPRIWRDLWAPSCKISSDGPCSDPVEHQIWRMKQSMLTIPWKRTNQGMFDNSVVIIFLNQLCLNQGIIEVL